MSDIRDFEPYFEEGASDDMGIFAGYGAGFYFRNRGDVCGPYFFKEDAEIAATFCRSSENRNG